MSVTTPEPATPPRRHPWGWIMLCAVLTAAVVGVGIWALSLNSDLNSQKDATTQAEQQAKSSQQQLDSISSQVEDLSKQVTDAGEQLQQAGSDATENAQTAIETIKGDIDGFKGQLDTIKTKVKDALAAAEQSGG